MNITWLNQFDKCEMNELWFLWYLPIIFVPGNFNDDVLMILMLYKFMVIENLS
jgi:hypothetical protein